MAARLNDIYDVTSWWRHKCRHWLRLTDSDRVVTGIKMIGQQCTTPAHWHQRGFRSPFKKGTLTSLLREKVTNFTKCVGTSSVIVLSRSHKFHSSVPSRLEVMKVFGPSPCQQIAINLSYKVQHNSLKSSFLHKYINLVIYILTTHLPDWNGVTPTLGGKFYL